MVDQVARVATVLPADEQLACGWSPPATARRRRSTSTAPRGLARGTAFSGHNSYAHWWPDGSPPGAVIFLRYSRTTVERYCDALGPVAIVSNPWDVPNEVAGAPMLVHRLRGDPGDPPGRVAPLRE